MTTEGPEDKWHQLALAGRGDGRLEIPSLPAGVETGYGEVHFALGPSGQPRLLVPCSSSALGWQRDPGTRLAITPVTLHLEGRSTLFIDLLLVDQRLAGVFAELVREVLSRLEGGAAPQAAVFGAIEDFRALLERPPRREISASEILGLIGELLVLKRLCEVSPEAIHTWTGPQDHRQDFRVGNRAIEVKTSGRADARAVRINGMEQLSAPAGGQLHLVHVRVERAEQGEMSVPALISGIRSLGVDEERFSELLGALGCAFPGASGWDDVSFQLESVDCYRVEEGFPRISADTLLSGELPAGVGSLTYEVDLSAARGYRLDPEAVRSLFDGFI